MKNMVVKLVLLSVFLTAFGCSLSLAQPNLHEAWVVECEDGDTVKVKLTEKPDKLEGIRYLLASAPEKEDCLGLEATDYNRDLVFGKQLWLELEPQDGDYLRVHMGDRILAYAYLDPYGVDMVNLRLVQTGSAKIDVRDVKDDTPPSDFKVKYLDRFTQAQIEAARERRGWWGECDDYKDSNLVIVFAKFWGGDEIIYILNRGEEEFSLISNWKLIDEAGNEIIFTPALTLGEECFLPPGGILRVHSGPDISQEYSLVTCGEAEVDFYWTRRKIWTNKRDTATLESSYGNYRYEYKGG